MTATKMIIADAGYQRFTFCVISYEKLDIMPRKEKNYNNLHSRTRIGNWIVQEMRCLPLVLSASLASDKGQILFPAGRHRKSPSCWPDLASSNQSDAIPELEPQPGVFAT